mgnify:CR=1 FL=1
MFKVGDSVKINPYMKCDALQNNLGMENLDGIFKVLEVKEEKNSKNQANDRINNGNFRVYWITIQLPNGNKKRVSDLWLVATSGEK